MSKIVWTEELPSTDAYEGRCVQVELIDSMVSGALVLVGRYDKDKSGWVVRLGEGIYLPLEDGTRWRYLDS